MIYHNHISYLKRTLEPDEGYPHQELYEWSESYLKSMPPNKTWKNFKWCHRYNTLKQNTVFFNNVNAIDNIIWKSSSIDEFLVEVDLNGFSAEAVNFVICYCYMEPGKFFSSDWRILDKQHNEFDVPPFSSRKESIAWHIYNTLYKEISTKGLPMLEVDDFIAHSLSVIQTS